MAGLHLVTGYQGTPHITAADQGLYNAMTAGVGDYVLTKGERFRASAVNSNYVRIYDGCLITGGRQVNLDSGTYLDAYIANGVTGQKRHDIIAVRYERNAATGIESASIIVETGTATTGTPTDASIKYPDSIVDGATIHDMPLYRVVLSGTQITALEPLFQILAPMAEIQHSFYRQNMLINGDFQSNQRGESEYSVTTTAKYTLDMWRAHQVKVKQVDEGINIINLSTTQQGFFTQFVRVDEHKTTPYTISALVDGKVCTFTTTLSATSTSKDFDKVRLAALFVTDSNKKWIKVNICPIGTNSVTIKYIDLFEGSVAYPHIKEDYVTALNRCRQYVQVDVFSQYPLFTAEDSNWGEDGARVGYFIHDFNRTIDTPTLTSCQATFCTPNPSYIEDVKMETKDVLSDIAVAVITRRSIEFWMKVSGSNSTSVIKFLYTISCEPTYS